ncbi:MAG: hypothetical protein H7Y30_01405 [Pyrinomonadaceae bacterium]|nr:hypothetical protein [Pyrinomonadaceae bacterium]
MQEQINIRTQAQDFREQLGKSAGEVFDFFICFSKFECALKQAGYWKWERNMLSPNWDAFVVDIAPEFDKQDDRQRGELLNTAIEFFQNDPPRKQILNEDDQIDFKGDGYDAGLKGLIHAIKCVRNNLFHGGKYPYRRHLREPARDDHLLNHSLVILQECLNLCGTENLSEELRSKTQKVRNSFESRIE